MKNRLDTGLSLLLTLAAVVMATAYVWDRVASPFPAMRNGSGAIQEPEEYPDWRGWLAKGTAVGPDSAPVVVVTFTDFECPVCARFHETTLKETMRAFGPSVSATIVHFPLKGHRFAEISAVAAECAGEQGVFLHFVDLMFQKQDSLGLKSWGSFASEGGVLDKDGFQACINTQGPLERVRAGRELGDEIGIRGTPTVFVNGWRLPAVPGEAELSQAIQSILDGEGLLREPG